MVHFRVGKQRKAVSYKGKILNRANDTYIWQAYGKIRSQIMLAVEGKKQKRLVIASALPGEGRTLSCVNLGISLAQLETRVLIIDCNIYNPQIHSALGIENEEGLMEILKGESTASGVIRRTSYENLDVITLGSSNEKNEEMLISSQMEDALQILGEQYEYILLDTSPFNMMYSTAFLTKNATGTIIVVRERKSTYSDVDQLLKKLERANSQVLGFILTDDIEEKRKYKKLVKNKKYQVYIQ